jgi:hypothetical protein
MMLVLLLALGAGIASAQDAKTVIQNAQKTIGDVNSIQYSGSGKAGGLGQNWSPTVTWHTTIVTSYTKTIDYASRSSKEELTRTQMNPPDHGGEAPFAGEQKQVNMVSGQYAWNQPGAAPQPALAAADERQLQIWLTPHGFLKAAADNNATAKAGKDGGQKVTVLTFMAGQNKVTGDVDDKGMVTKVETWIPNPVLGDMLVETSYSDYKDFGGVKFRPGSHGRKIQCANYDWSERGRPDRYRATFSAFHSRAGCWRMRSTISGCVGNRSSAWYFPAAIA